jgi:hypothetical protein
MTDADEAPVYIHLPAGAEPPTIASQPCRIVVIIEQDVTIEWQAQVSKWIVDTGCLYMMAWGKNCSSWDDSVDYANLEDHNFGEIPEDKFVMTTWHENEPLEEVFWYCRYVAHDPTIELLNVFILHISAQPKEAELLSRYWTELAEE